MAHCEWSKTKTHKKMIIFYKEVNLFFTTLIVLPQSGGELVWANILLPATLTSDKLLVTYRGRRCADMERWVDSVTDGQDYNQWLSTTLSAKWFGRLVPDDTKWLVKSDWLACCCNHCSLRHVALPQNKLLRERVLLSNSVNCQTYLLILKKEEKKGPHFQQFCWKKPL